MPIMFSPSLCISCHHKREIHNKRGSIFLLCSKSKEDDRFAKYPVQPVVACQAYVREEKRGEKREERGHKEN